MINIVKVEAMKNQMSYLNRKIESTKENSWKYQKFKKKQDKEASHGLLMLRK